MKKLSRNNAGFSFIELLLGISILVLVAGSAVIFLLSLSRGNVIVSAHGRVNREQRMVTEYLRDQANGPGFDLMSYNGDLIDNEEPFIRDVKTWVWVSAVQGTRTRTATIVSKVQTHPGAWTEGPGGTVYVSTQTFVLVRGRSREGGALIRIKALEQGTNFPIPNLTVSGPMEGAVGTNVSANTNESGIAVLSNFVVDSDGLDDLTTNPIVVTLNADGTEHVFGSAAPYTLVLASATGPTLPKVTKNLGTIYLRKRGTVGGTVSDAVSSSNIGGAAVLIYPVSLDVTGTDPQPRIAYTAMDGDKTYQFNGVYPGQYVVYCLGNSQYVSLSKPNDHYSSGGIDPPVSVPISGTVSRNFQTVKRGSVQDALTAADWDGSGYVAAGAVNKAVALVVSRENTQTRLSPSGTASDLSETTAWRDVLYPNGFGSNPADGDEGPITVTSDSNGQFRVDSILPLMADASNALTDQYGNLQILTDQYVPSPFLPIVIQTGATPKVLANVYNVATLWPGGTPETDFSKSVFTAVQNQVVGLKLLKTSALTYITGQVFQSDGVSPFLVGPGYVQIYNGALMDQLGWGANMGGVEFEDMGGGEWRTWINPYFKSATSIVGGVHSFNLQTSEDSPGFNAPRVIRNVGGEKTVIRFQASIDPIPFFTIVTGSVQVRKKVNGPPIQWQTVVNSNISNLSIGIYAEAYSEIPEYTSVVNTTAGSFTAPPSGQYTFYRSDLYESAKTEVTLNAGPSTTQNLTISSASPVATYPEKFIGLPTLPADYSSNGERPRATWNGALLLYNAADPIYLTHKPNIIKLYGTVRTAAGNTPIVGAQITLTLYGDGEPGPYSFTTVADDDNCVPDMNYCIQNVVFGPEDVGYDDFSVQAEYEGFQLVVESREGYEDGSGNYPAERIDFIMSEIPGEPPPGGGDL